MFDIDIAETILAGIKQARESGLIPAFAYDRVSDEGQTLGISLEFQEYQAKKYAEDKGFYIVYSFTKVESAWKKGRKIFDLMLKLSRQFGVKELLFKNVDRMSRNWEDLAEIKAMYEQEACNIHFYLNGRIISKSSNYEDKSILELEIWIAKRGSDRTSHMVSSANKYKIEKGVMPGRAPVGYNWDGNSKQHIIDKDKSNMLNFIFGTFDQTQTSVRALATIVNEKGYRTSTGRKWSPSQIHHVLCNPFYHGEFRSGEEIHRGIHEPYYEKDRYENRMKRMHIQHHSARKRDYEFNFAGLLECEGKALTGEIKKEKYIYYTNRFTEKSYREERIFEMLDAEVNSIEFSDDFGYKLKELFRESVRVKNGDDNESLASTNRRLSELDLKKTKLIELLIDDEIDKRALRSLTEQCNQEIDRLEKDRKRLRLNKDDFVFKMADVIDSIKKLPALYKTSNSADKIKLLKEVSSGIIVSDDEVKVKWDLPFAFILNQEVMSFADTSEEVRKYPVMLPESDTFRTILFRKSFEAQLYFASKVA